MQRPEPWPDWLDDVWAKSPAKDEARGETLAAHTWRVLQRLSDLYHMRPELAQTLGVSNLWQRLYWACLLHDLGKCAPGFQLSLRRDTPRSSPLATQWANTRHRHEVFSLAFVDWVYPPVPTPDPARLWVIAGVATHHKDQRAIEEQYPLYLPQDTEALLDQIIKTIQLSVVAGIYDWLNACAVPWAQQLGLPDELATLVAPRADAIAAVTQRGGDSIVHSLDEFARWSARLERKQSFSPAEMILRGLITQSDHTASAHASSIRPFAADTDALKARWEEASVRRGQTFNLYAHQEQCAHTRGAALLVAPTGSGKTEAALLWAAAQKSAPRLFYTLPYQASMNAMWVRLCDVLGSDNVQMQHGRGLLALYRLIMETAPNPDKAAQQARWRLNLARLHHAPVQVFSPYQMLKAMYRLKGYEGMLADFQDAAFIFDEIHAYEANRLALIVESMRYLRERHAASFFIMSATFPSLIRERLLEALQTSCMIPADNALYQAFQRHTLNVLEGDLFDTVNWRRVIGQAKSGKSVLVCCNTVGRAQAAQQQLRAELPDATIVLLHGRLNMRDRSAREKAVRDAVGSTSAQRSPIVLVATQVVEVSLDIDLDTIFTDPAPLEALIQRFGRINRRRLIRPTAAVHVFTQPIVDMRPYEATLVDAAVHILRREHGRPIQEDHTGNWLDEIYTGDIAREWQSKYERSAREFRESCLASLRPFQSDPEIESVFYRAFDGVEVLPACLADEYDRQREEDPILAQELLVPIRYGQLQQIRNAGRLQSKTHPILVDVPYDGGAEGIGLDLSALRR